jgi:UDP-N-acetylglucosamine 3-dehydrogenase
MTNTTIITRVAVIGVGAMGYNHARVYADLPDVELVGVADVDERAVLAASQKYHCGGYTDYRQLLAEAQPEAITIAVPTVDHLEVALHAIERGIHVLIEKPIAFTLDEGQAIIAAAEASGTRLMIGHIERFNPAVLALKARLEAGELGRVFQIDARRQGPFPARVKDVGVVIDLAVHDLDVMRYITGAEVMRAYAETERRIHSSHEDLLSGLVRLDDGTVGTLTINWLTPTKIRELVVTGELGMFRVDYLTQDLYFFENGTVNGSDWPALRMLRGVSEGRMIRYVVAKKEPLRLEQEAFLAAVRGEQPVMVTGEDGLQALRLAEALVKSGTSQQIVSLMEQVVG